MYTTLDIHARLIETFPNCKIPLRETAGTGTVASKKSKTTYLDEGAHFILQLHDELYYEVKRELKYSHLICGISIYFVKLETIKLTLRTDIAVYFLQLIVFS